MSTAMSPPTGYAPTRGGAPICAKSPAILATKERAGRVATRALARVVGRRSV